MSVLDEQRRLLLFGVFTFCTSIRIFLVSLFFGPMFLFSGASFRRYTSPKPLFSRSCSGFLSGNPLFPFFPFCLIFYTRHCHRTRTWPCTPTLITLDVIVYISIKLFFLTLHKALLFISSLAFIADESNPSYLFQLMILILLQPRHYHRKVHPVGA